MKILIKLNWTHMCIGKLCTTLLSFPSFSFIYLHETKVFREFAWFRYGKTIERFRVRRLVRAFFMPTIFVSSAHTNLFVCASELKVFRRICWWFEITLRTTFYLVVLLFIVVYNVNWPNVSHCFCDVLTSTMTYNGIYYQNHCMINFDTFNQLISVHCA